ncbi:MAG: 16S rRNA (cytidine(1402)-2'-O)-methyltransferase, partial [Casimicrobiaceae bacterium]
MATPLGNLRDLTLRARDVLSTADVIAAEDTRTSATLLRHYGITTRTLSLHSHNEAQRVETIAALLRGGSSVALISDAGTPAISDPGARLVRAMHDAGVTVIPIPGPSALVAAVSAAGLDAEAFLFAGFLPQQGKARRERLQALAPLPVALVFYEAPHRVRAAIDDLVAALGPERILIVARELTKTFETIARMPLAQAPAWVAADANRE